MHRSRSLRLQAEPTLAILLLNTRAGVGLRADALRSGDDAEWFERHDLAAYAPHSLPDGRIWRMEASALREAIEVGVHARIRGEEPPDTVWPRLDRAAQAAPLTCRILIEPTGAALFAEDERPSPEALLAAMARSAVPLLTTAKRDRIRRCADPRCQSWFVDSSRGGRRRWCSMRTCGNRAKARAHYEKRRAGGPPGP